MTLISTACSWVSILGGQKAAIIAQVGQFYFDEVGQYYSGANIDGREIVSDLNKAAYYIPSTEFNPIVVYPTPTSYGSVAALAYQGYAIVSPPLSVGTHVIKLYEPYILESPESPVSLGVIYDNTWIVTVTPH